MDTHDEFISNSMEASTTAYLQGTAPSGGVLLSYSPGAFATGNVALIVACNPAQPRSTPLKLSWHPLPAAGKLETVHNFMRRDCSTSPT